MERIGSYSAYGSVYGQEKSKANTKTAGAKEKEKTGNEGKVNLSSSAKNLLKELQKAYGNMDFIIADYESEEEAASYLSRGKNDYSVLLTPEELEKMAADEDYKKQNLKTLDDAVSKLGEMKNQLGESGQDVKRLGVAIGDDGEVSFFAELEKTSEKQRERIDRQRENRREEAADAKKKAEQEKLQEAGLWHGGVKRTVVYASSVEELSEKIKETDWSRVKEEDYSPVGNRFDFTV
ncbi:MAG: DUF6033 family protein [bacterium]|nr:DUF6033 family protein [bacterium]